MSITTSQRLTIAGNSAYIASILLVLGIAVAFIPNISPVSLTFLQTWWLLVAALGIFCAGFASKQGSLASGLLVASLLTGFASQLVFTRPIWFQTIIPSWNSRFEQLSLLVIAVQFLATVSALLWRSAARHFISAIPSRHWWRILAVLAILCLFSFSAMPAIGRRDPLQLVSQVILGSGFILLNLFNLLAVLVWLPQDIAKRLGRAVSPVFLNHDDRNLPQLKKYFPYIVSLWVLLITCTICVFAFERLPHVEDEVAYLFQAKTLLLGLFSVPAPPIPEAFDFYLLQVEDGRWYATTTPGWALALAVGMLANAAWLVNPLLAAVSILLAHRLVCRVADRKSANLTILLMAISPWLIATSASFMNHTITLATTLGCWLAFHRAQSQRSAGLAVIAGLCAGVLFLTRPVDGLIIGILTGLWSLQFLRIKGGLTRVLCYSAGCIAVGSFVFIFNSALTGDPLLTPLNKYIDQIWYPGANRMGFGDDIGPPSQWGNLDLYKGHHPSESLVHFQHNSYMTNFELFGAGIGSCLLLLVHMLWGHWSRFEKQMFAVISVTILVYGLYWFSGGFYIGPRYWFLCFFPLTLLSASGVKTLVQILSDFSGATQTLNAGRVGAGLLIVCIISTCIFLPWRGGTRYYESRGYHDDFRQILADTDLNNSLVFMRDATEGEYGSALILSQPDFSGSAPIFAHDRGAADNLLLAEHFPQRKIFVVEGRKQDNKARVVEGPMSLETFRQRADSAMTTE